MDTRYSMQARPGHLNTITGPAVAGQGTGPAVGGQGTGLAVAGEGTGPPPIDGPLVGL